MSFSNLAGEGPDAAAAYVANLLALLGDQDPLTVLTGTPAWCADAVAQVPAARLQRAESPGKWSVAGVLQHLADSEGVNGHRIRTMLVEDHPTIAAYDQDAWARVFDYASADPHTAMRDFAAIRAANLRLWQSLDVGALARGGVHAERGVETVGNLLRLLAAHDLVHRRQIERILRQ
jgi:C4-dicarboxylate-specific signal transduction histidine kinase